MGGPGSGRNYYSGSRHTTENLRSIDIRRWKRDGLLDRAHAFSWQWLRRNKVVASIWVEPSPERVVLSYRQRSRNSEWTDEKYTVRLSWTPCHFGGQRPWFICPALGCGQRVAILYGGAKFTCRNCQGLAYPSQRETPGDRAGRKANRIRRKLGWEPGILNGTGWKPHGMHWDKFWKLYEEQNRLARVTVSAISRQLGLGDPAASDPD